MASKFIPPDLSNATPEMLVDEMGKLSVVENHAKKLRAFYKEAYLARKSIPIADKFSANSEVSQAGDIFVATTTRSDPARVDIDDLKTNHFDTYKEVLKQKPQLTTRFTLKEGVINPIVNDLLLQMKQELDLE